MLTAAIHEWMSAVLRQLYYIRANLLSLFT